MKRNWNQTDRSSNQETVKRGEQGGGAAEEGKEQRRRKVLLLTPPEETSSGPIISGTEETLNRRGDLELTSARRAPLRLRPSIFHFYPKDEGTPQERRRSTREAEEEERSDGQAALWRHSAG